MKIKPTSIKLMNLFWMILAFLVYGFLTSKVHAQSETGPPEVQVKKIAVMPLLIGRYGSTVSETLNAPISRLYFDPENIGFNSDQVLTGYVQEALKAKHGERVVTLADVREAYEQISKDREKDTPRILAQKVGKALGANLIMAGNIWRYKERMGGSAGVERPASVAFAVYLIDVPGGKMLWKAKFEETQRSLSENILDAKAFFKKGAKWLSANDLARYGVREIFKKYPF